MSELTGIVLMGGRSRRMGTDKSQLKINEHTLAEHMAAKLIPWVNEVYFSINQNQVNLTLTLPTIVDDYTEEGPISGIISALKYTQKSIVVLGVDLPKISDESIKILIGNRNWNLLTTTYYNVTNSTWEPMLSIWELETLPCLESYFESGGRSLQTFLHQYGNQRVPVLHQDEFMNVNTMEEYKKLIEFPFV